MDWTNLEQLRVTGFTVTRRGYDTREVDRFLEDLIQWLDTDAAQQIGDEAVQRKLELVGKSTAHILLTTENEAKELRTRTEQECAQLRKEADAAATETRRLADEYSASTRTKADEYAANVRAKTDEAAQRTKEAAAEQARKTIEEGDRRRAAAERIVAELESQRDAALAELESLRGMLLTTISKHTTRTAPEQRQGEARRRRANIEHKAETEVPAER
jgi:DivIVA domain-containing protein